VSVQAESKMILLMSIIFITHYTIILFIVHAQTHTHRQCDTDLYANVVCYKYIFLWIEFQMTHEWCEEIARVERNIKILKIDISVAEIFL
jgi:hypothetical protein